MRLSVLDLMPVPTNGDATQAARNTIELARLADSLGYTRYWLAEHHGSERLAGSTPEIMIAAVAGATSRIRVGSGAVLMRFYSPLKVAETFSTLAALYPGRIDLGIGRGRGATPEHAAALLRGQQPTGAEDFILELLAFLTGAFPDDHPYGGLVVSPAVDDLPDVWLLGTSKWSAEHAADIGLPLAYATFLEHDDAHDAFERYRRNFNPEGMFPHPATIVAVDAVCSDSDEHADGVAFEPDDTPGLPSWGTPICGSPEHVAEKLTDLAARLKVDEVMVTTLIDNHEARLESYRLLAKHLL